MDGLPHSDEITLSDVQSTAGLLLALLILAVIVWIFREVTGLRDGPSVPAMLGRVLRACLPAALACWRWSVWLWVRVLLAVAAIFFPSVVWPARPRPPS